LGDFGVSPPSGFFFFPLLADLLGVFGVFGDFFVGLSLLFDLELGFFLLEGLSLYDLGDLGDLPPLDCLDFGVPTPESLPPMD
jgi:hypothetical protein